MKRCPQCRVEYFDEMLEFCLDDGAKLTVVSRAAKTAEPKIPDTNQGNVETQVFAGLSEVPKTIESDDFAKVSAPSPDETKLISLKEKAVEKGHRTLETGTLVFALVHNWWQWLYVDRQTYGSISNFLFSADFLIWFLLLFGGTVAGLLTLKFSRKKTLAYAGLVVLAINFLLLLVPKK